MKITYIGHSGFLVETPSVSLIFDCIGKPVLTPEDKNKNISCGLLPSPDPSKPLIVFVSHRHADHYSPGIWHFKDLCPNTTYILSDDIPKETFPSWFSEDDLDRIIYVSPGKTYFFPLSGEAVLKIETLFSTDEGTAFFLTLNGRTIYHAGDLGLWAWPDSGGISCKDAARQEFESAISPIRGRNCDIAFMLLDPRLGEAGFEGMNMLLDHLHIRYVFPMHLFKQYGFIDSYLTSRKNKACSTAVMRISHENEIFDIDIT